MTDETINDPATPDAQPASPAPGASDPQTERIGEESAGNRRRRVRALDFSRPMKLSPVEQRRFEAAHATFCRDASMRLSSELRSPIELEVLSFAQMTWTTAHREVPALSIIAVLSARPLETSLLLGIEEPFVIAMIERMLGGAEQAAPASRNLTDIDMAIAGRLFTSLVEQLSVAWQDLLGLRLMLVDVLPQHSSVELVLPSEPTLAITIQARHSGGASRISLLVPYSSIEQASHTLSGIAQGAEDGSARQEGDSALRSAIGAVSVELRAEVGSVAMKISDVLALGEGDLVRIGPVGNEGVYGGVERLHRARPGRSGARRAVQIIEGGPGT